MKMKLFLVWLAALAIAAPLALAAPPTGKGKPPTTGTGCKPLVSVILKGTVATAPGVSATLPFNLQVHVTTANEHGAAYVKLTQPITVTLATTTKVNRQGHDSLASLLAGDRIVVHARSCKASLANNAVPALTATRVDAQAATS